VSHFACGKRAICRHASRVCTVLGRWRRSRRRASNVSCRSPRPVGCQDLVHRRRKRHKRRVIGPGCR